MSIRNNRFCKCGHTELFHQFPSFIRWCLHLARGKCTYCECSKFKFDYEVK